MRFRLAICVLMVAGVALGQDGAPAAASTVDDQEKKETPTLRGFDPAAKDYRTKVNEAIAGWPECDEYLSASRCKVTVNMSNSSDPSDPKHGPLMPRAHWDVQVKPFIHLNAKPRGEAAVVLERSSPFMKCTVAAVPGTPGRDLSANIGSLLTAAAGIGAVSSIVANGSQVPFANMLPNDMPLAEDVIAPLARLEQPPSTATSIPELDGIESQINQIHEYARLRFDTIRKSYRELRDTLTKDWKYSFMSKGDVAPVIDELKGKITPVKEALAAFIGIGADVSLLDAAAARFEKDGLPSHPEALRRFRTDQENIARLKAHIEVLKDRLTDLGDNRKQMAALESFLDGLDTTADYTQQILPMAYFSGKTVTETISCKDAMTKDPVGDNIIFTAYYESLPHWDISVGAIGSLLGGRQVGAITGPYSTAQANACAAATFAASQNSTQPPNCGPQTVLGYTSKSAYQFMPGVFVEQRLKNGHCWGAKNGAPWHPFGYLCSIGLAEGVAINPNNGGPAAEFFEGISFGIQRFAILIGFHDGRYEDYAGGYYLGETFPTGTMVTPPVAHGWAVHPAFGIAYRVPPR